MSALTVKNYLICIKTSLTTPFSSLFWKSFSISWHTNLFYVSTLRDKNSIAFSAKIPLNFFNSCWMVSYNLVGVALWIVGRGHCITSECLTSHFEEDQQSDPFPFLTSFSIKTKILNLKKSEGNSIP